MGMRYGIGIGIAVPNKVPAGHFASSGQGALSQTLPQSTALAFWTPALLPGLFAWYRADLGVTTVSGNVSAWADQSGSGNDLAESIVIDRPTYHASGGANNQAYIKWDPTVDAGNQSLGNAAVTIPANHDIFVVARALNTAYPSRLWMIGSEQLYATAPLTLTYYNTGVSASLTAGVDFAIQCTANGASSELRYNGASQGTGTESGSASSITIGNYTGVAGNNSWDGFIYEWFGCNVVTNADRLKVQSYLSGRYGVTFS
jgi:hypothetical protein